MANNRENDEEETSDELQSEPEPQQTQFSVKSLSSPIANVKKSKSQSSPTTQQKQPTKTDSSSSEEEEEESGSGSESETDKYHRYIRRPAASKPIDDLQDLKPKGKDANPRIPVKSAGAKRSAADEKEEKESKRAKNKSEPENSEKNRGGATVSSKTPLFQRLWSEEDEIVILNGILDYKAKFKSNPNTDFDAFHDLIRKNLHVDVSKAQLQDKMRRLKKKYFNNENKEKEGKNKSFSRAHEQKVYELSKKIWGSDNGKANEGELKANGGMDRRTSSRKATNVENGYENDIVMSRGNLGKPDVAKRVCSNGLGGHDMILCIGAELFEGNDMVEGKKEWKKLMEEEIEIHLKQLDLMRARAKLVMDVVKSKND